jgi:hypothetical protein
MKRALKSEKSFKLLPHQKINLAKFEQTQFFIPSKGNNRGDLQIEWRK